MSHYHTHLLHIPDFRSTHDERSALANLNNSPYSSALHPIREKQIALVVPTVYRTFFVFLFICDERVWSKFISAERVCSRISWSVCYYSSSPSMHDEGDLLLLLWTPAVNPSALFYSYWKICSNSPKPSIVISASPSIHNKKSDLIILSFSLN